MSRLRVFCFMYITFHLSQASIELFMHKDVSPKCCSQDEILSMDNSVNQPYNCTPDVNRTSYVLTNEILPIFPWNAFGGSDAISCIDDVFNEENAQRGIVKINFENTTIINLNLKFFPKCCPSNSAYDTFEHKCVNIINETYYNNFLSFTDEILTEHLTEGLFFMKTGLSECNTVIADYELDYFNMTIFNKNRGIFLETLNQTFPYGSYCVDKVYNSENYMARICHSNFNICRKNKSDNENIRCIKKCCPDGSIYKGSPKCSYDFEHGLSFGNDSKVQNLDEPFAIVQGHNCRKYLVESTWNYTLDEVGNLKLNLEEDQTSHSPFEQTYCYEHVDLGVIQGRQLFLCFKLQDQDRLEFKFTRIALLFSVVFLKLTLVGYILLPEMQNLHGKTLMCHCGSLLVAFFVLGVTQFHPTMDGAPCIASGYIIMYLFLSAFMWSNIMCFDIWWTFGSMRVQGINQRKRELKRFIWYCCYAWTTPLVITGAAFTVQYFRLCLPEFLQPIAPKLGGFSCFFEQRTNMTAFLTWFTLPLALIILCNFVLYIKTIRYCYKVKNEIEKMNDTQSNINERKKALSADNERMKMALKLFLVMGIPWIFESISMSSIPLPAKGAARVIQIMLDTFNCLQGVFIFCIFILKVKFIKALQKKLGVSYLRRTSQSTSSAATVTTYMAKV